MIICDKISFEPVFGSKFYDFMEKIMNNYKRGLAAGIPIALGYLSVSFTFGIMAVSYGLSWWQALIISMATVTSAGQFAGIGIMIHPGQYFQMLISISLIIRLFNVDLLPTTRSLS